MKKVFAMVMCLAIILCFSACNTSGTGVSVTTSSETSAGETSLLSQSTTSTSKNTKKTSKTSAQNKTTPATKNSSTATKSSTTKPLSSTTTSGSKSTSTSPTTTTTTTTTIDTVKNNNEQVKKVLQKVLTHEQNFTFKSLVFDEVTEENLEKFTFPSEDFWKNTFLPQAYMFVDFDSDNVEELLIIDMWLQFFLILRYENNAVFGYILTNIDLQNIKTDGTFLTRMYYTEPPTTAISKVSFEGLNCQVTNLAYKDESKNEYRLNEKPAEKEAVLTYFDDWNKNTTKLTWTML